VAVKQWTAVESTVAAAGLRLRRDRSFASLPDGKNIFFNSTDPQPDEIFADHTS